MSEPPRARRSIRVPGYDYTTPGAYFVTICEYQRKVLFEEAVLANILRDDWLGLPTHFASIRLDAFVIMPNHVHFIVWLGSVGVPLAGTPTVRVARRHSGGRRGRASLPLRLATWSAPSNLASLFDG